MLDQFDRACLIVLDGHDQAADEQQQVVVS
jgi:hypothetical protein